MLKRFLREETGATAIEYGLIAALISVSLLAGYMAIGDSLTAQWQQAATDIEAAGSDHLP
jgi:pilus assembly protein Flp/PilA